MTEPTPEKIEVTPTGQAEIVEEQAEQGFSGNEIPETSFEYEGNEHGFIIKVSMWLGESSAEHLERSGTIQYNQAGEAVVDPFTSESMARVRNLAIERCARALAVMRHA